MKSLPRCYLNSTSPESYFLHNFGISQMSYITRGNTPLPQNQKGSESLEKYDQIDL